MPKIDTSPPSVARPARPTALECQWQGCSLDTASPMLFGVVYGTTLLLAYAGEAICTYPPSCAAAPTYLC